MRKITSAAVNAFAAGRAWQQGNTQVLQQSSRTMMLLHGNLIAMRDRYTDGTDYVLVKLAGWPTPTTRERVNGIFNHYNPQWGISQRNHQQWLVCDTEKIRQIDDDEWVRVYPALDSREAA